MRATILFIRTVTLAGVVLLAVGATKLAHLPMQTAALLAIGVLLTELMQIEPDATVSTPDHHTRFSFSSGVHLAAIVLLGPWGAAILAAGGVAAVDGLRGTPPRTLGFNAGVFAITAAVGGYLYLAAGGEVGPRAFTNSLPQVVLLAASIYAINSLLVSGPVAGFSGRPIVGVLRETVDGQLLSASSEAGFGIALAYLLAHNAWLVLTLAPLVFGVYTAHLRLEEQRRETARALETFANVVDERDSFTSHHSARVAELAEEFARWLGYPSREIARLRAAARLHDLGKIVVDASVLHKPGRLDAREWLAVRRHPQISSRLLRRFHLAVDQARAVEYHHERFDGDGYYGIPGEEVPIAAHILVAADSFDAMTSDRPYRTGLTEAVALAELERGSGAQFHPVVAKAFVACQRGIAPSDALEPSERDALRNLWGERRSQRIATLARAARPRHAALFAGVASIGALAGGAPVAAIVLVTVAGLAAAAHFVAERDLGVRRRRLSSTVLAAPPGDERLEALIAGLGDLETLGWAGVVRAAPGERRVIEREWLGATPPERSLFGWLARESPESIAVAGATEVGRTGTLVALPLTERSADARLVIVVNGRRARRIVSTLRAGWPELAAALAIEPAREGRPPRMLRAVV